jgi:hypothetical protein
MLGLFEITYAGSSPPQSTINGKQVEWILLFGKYPNPVVKIPQDGKRKKIPIVLVHGNRSEDEPQARWDTFIIQTSSLDQFDFWIWKHDTSKAIGFNGNTGNAIELADCLNNFIFPHYRKGTKAVLVAHSRGGLVCRSFMNYDNDNNGTLDGERISGLITLGTPHHGSPAAVPDWAAFSFREDNIGPETFDWFYGPGKSFSTDRLGDINLAWDNEDGIIQSGYFSLEYDTDISVNGEMDLSIRDTNRPVKIEYNDDTIFFKDSWDPPDYKSIYGTLAELNDRDKYYKKIIVYGAYDNNLRNNPISIPGALFQLEHDKLEVATVLLNRFDVNGVTREGINFYANDGLVPLQSALLLKISDGQHFSTKSQGSVSLDDELINSHRQVRKHRIYTGNIKDHLDLLDTDNQQYWETIISDIKAFSSRAMPWIPLLLTTCIDCEQILLDAPNNGYFYYGMYSPDVRAASFTLSSNKYVTTINVTLHTPDTTSFTTFEFSLQDSCTSPSTTFASASFTVPPEQISSETINVNQNLPAGTYYIVGVVPGYDEIPVTPGDVMGWMISTGVYKSAAGTIADGVWINYGSTCSFNSNNYAPAFSVRGLP